MSPPPPTSLLHYQQSLNSTGDLSKMLRHRSGTIYLEIFKQGFHCRTSQSLEHADMNQEKSTRDTPLAT